MNPPKPKAFTEDQREEIKEIMHEAISEYFTDKGALGEWLIVMTAKIVVSLGVIGGGAYWFLSALGFHRG